MIKIKRVSNLWSFQFDYSMNFMIHKNRSVFIISRTPSASQFVISKCLLVVDHECSTAFGSVFFFSMRKRCTYACGGNCVLCLISNWIVREKQNSESNWAKRIKQPFSFQSMILHHRIRFGSVRFVYFHSVFFCFFFSRSHQIFIFLLRSIAFSFWWKRSFRVYFLLIFHILCGELIH